MKAASGELNLTVITIVAITLIATFFTVTMWPNIKNTINSQWNDVTNTTGNAIKNER